MKRLAKSLWCIMATMLMLVVAMPMPIEAKTKKGSLKVIGTAIQNNKVIIKINVKLPDDDYYFVYTDISRIENGKQVTFNNTAYQIEEGGTYEDDMTYYIDQTGLYEFDYVLTDNYDSYGHSYSYLYGYDKVYLYITKESGTYSIANYGHDPYANLTSKDKKNIKKQLTMFFKYVKNYNVGGIKSCVKTDRKNSYINERSAQQFIRKANKKRLLYKINSVNVSGNTAKVRMDVTCYNSCYAVKNALQKQLTSMVKTRKLNYSKMISDMNRFYRKDITYEWYPTTIKLIKVKGKWKIKKMTGDLQFITNCGMIDALEYFSEHPGALLFD